MRMLSKLLRRSRSAMLLEVEGQAPTANPSEDQVRAAVLGLRRGGATFASLTNESEDYIQLAGSRPWCVVECRTHGPLQHARAFQTTNTPKYNDGAKLWTGAGEITLQHDEWFLLKDAAEIFVAFHQGKAFPDRVQWRLMNEALGLD